MKRQYTAVSRQWGGFIHVYVWLHGDAAMTFSVQRERRVERWRRRAADNTGVGGRYSDVWLGMSIGVATTHPHRARRCRRSIFRPARHVVHRRQHRPTAASTTTTTSTTTTAPTPSYWRSITPTLTPRWRAHSSSATTFVYPSIYSRLSIIKRRCIGRPLCWVMINKNKIKENIAKNNRYKYRTIFKYCYY